MEEMDSLENDGETQCYVMLMKLLVWCRLTLDIASLTTPCPSFQYGLLLPRCRLQCDGSSTLAWAFDTVLASPLVWFKHDHYYGHVARYSFEIF